ncbi:MAG: hypothetical protein ACE5PV_11305 [Candidatus Poribacteria bacterium]
MSKILLILSILISIICLISCAARQTEYTKPIGNPKPDVETWPLHTPDWVAGALGPNQVRGVSKPAPTEQEAFSDAYLNAIHQISMRLGAIVESREVRRYAVKSSVYDPQISSQLKLEYKHLVKDAYTVENYMERRRGQYTVYLLVTYDEAQLRADMQRAVERYRKLPPKGKSGQSHALWQAMDSLISTAERQNWPQTNPPAVYLKPIDRDIDDVLRQEIERTGELLVVDDPTVTETVLSGEYEKLSGDSRRLTLRLRGDPFYSWTCVATGFPYRSKSGAFFASMFPGGGQVYMKKRRWLTFAQVGLGLAFGASFIWHKDKYDDYKNLRGVTREELDAAYDETVLPHRLRIGFGSAFGGLWLLNTILAVYDAGQYQQMRQRSELEPLLSLEAMPGGVRLSRRF